MMLVERDPKPVGRLTPGDWIRVGRRWRRIAEVDRCRDGLGRYNVPLRDIAVTALVPEGGCLRRERFLLHSSDTIEVCSEELS